MELIKFVANNRYATGTSYVSAQEGTSSITLPTIEDVARYVTDLLNGFYSERTSNWSRWQSICKSDLHWHVHTQSLNYESNLGVISHYIDECGSWSCSGGIPDKYKIEVKKDGSLFVVHVETFVHIVIDSDMFSWFTEDMMKEALTKKLEYIRKEKF
jgi:hypothetical protein